MHYRPILIIGGHRTASSTLVETLINRHNFVSSGLFIPADDHNPQGYFEDKHVVNLCRQIYRANGENYIFEKTAPISQKDHNFENCLVFYLIATAELYQSQGKNLVIKCPWLAGIKWQIGNALKLKKIYEIIFIQRSEIDIIKSLTKRDSISDQRAKEFVNEYTRRSQQLQPRRISFQSVLRDEISSIKNAPVAPNFPIEIKISVKNILNAECNKLTIIKIYLLYIRQNYLQNTISFNNFLIKLFGHI